MPQSQTVSPILQLVPIAAIFVIFYFLLIRPQKTREKEHQKLLNSLNKNDEVVTTGGIHGTIVGVKDKTVIVRIDENVKIEIEKNGIAFVKKQQSATA